MTKEYIVRSDSQLMACSTIQKALQGRVLRKGSEISIALNRNVRGPIDRDVEQLGTEAATNTYKFIVASVKAKDSSLLDNRNRSDELWLKVSKMTQILIQETSLSLPLAPQDAQVSSACALQSATEPFELMTSRAMLVLSQWMFGERLFLAVRLGLRLSRHKAGAGAGAGGGDIPENSSRGDGSSSSNLLVRAPPLSGFSNLLRDIAERQLHKHSISIHNIWAADVQSSNTGAPAGNYALHLLLRRALAAQPCIVVFQDLDCLLFRDADEATEAHSAPPRVSAVSTTIQQFVNSVKRALPGFRQIFIIGRVRMENAHSALDHDLLRAFDDSLVIEKPSSATRRRCVDEVAGGFPGLGLDRDDDLLRETIVNKTVGLSLRETVLFAQNAFTARVRTCLPNKRETGNANLTPSVPVPAPVMPAGMSAVADVFTQYLLWPRLYKPIYTHFMGGGSAGGRGRSEGGGRGGNTFTGILLYGPPGTGKTMLVRHLHSLLRCRLLTMHISDLIRGEIGTGERALRKLFQDAKQLAPCIIFFDEFQSVFTNRTDSDGQTSADIGHTLSSTLAGCFDDIALWNSFAGLDSLVTVVGATNEPWAVDRGFLRAGRFEKCVFVGPLDRDARRTILMQKLSLPVEISANASAVLDIDAVVNATEGFTGADMMLLLQRAFRLHRRGGGGAENASVLASVSSVLSASSGSGSGMTSTVQPEDLADFLRWGVGQATIV